MTSYLIDINVWLALSWGGHPSPPAAHAWLSAEAGVKSRMQFCRITQLGLLRLLTNEMVTGVDALSLEEAFEVEDRWLEDPRVEFAAERHGLERFFREATVGVRKQKASKVLVDAYLIAFAGVEKATLITFDKGMLKLATRAGVNWRLLAARR